MNDAPERSGAPALEPVGRRLRAAREVRRVTLEDVENATHIRRRYLEAIEAGRAADIPGEVFLKGFLRTYANHLGLDGQALVEEYKRAADTAESERHEAERRAAAAVRRRRPARRVGRPPAAGSRPGAGAAAIPVAVVLGVLAVALVVHALTSGPRRPGAHRPEGATAGRSSATAPRGTGGTASTASSSTASAPPPGAGSSTAAAQAPVRPVRVATSFVHTNLGWQGTYVVSGSTSLAVAIQIGGSECWVRHWVDGVLQPDVFLLPHTTTTWTAPKSLRVLLGRVPAVDSVTVDGQATATLPIEGKNPETLVFELGGAGGSAAAAGGAA